MFINKLSKITYQILGPNLSTKLALSSIGTFIFNVLSPGNGKYRMYKADYDITLKLTKDEAKIMGVAFLGQVNPYESVVMQQKFKPGDTFIDIGAYVDGWYTLLASKLVGDKGEVYSLEPVFTDCLVQNVNINKLKNAVVDNYAISNKTGEANFYKGAGDSSLVKGQTRGGLKEGLEQLPLMTI